MNRQLLTHELRTSWVFLLTLCMGVFLFSLLIVAIYPSTKGQFQPLLKSLPPILKPFLQSLIGPATFESYATVAYNHPVFLALMTAWPITRASQAVASEIEGGTLGWVLAYPVSRGSFLFTRALVLLGGIAFMTLSMVAGFWLGFGLFHVAHGPVPPYLWAALETGLIYGAFGAIALWISAAANEISYPARYGAGLVIASFLLNYVAQVWKPFQPIRFLSLFDYYDPRVLLLGHAIPVRTLAVLTGVLLLCTMGAVLTFRQRELNI